MFSVKSSTDAKKRRIFPPLSCDDIYYFTSCACAAYETHFSVIASYLLNVYAGNIKGKHGSL